MFNKLKTIFKTKDGSKGKAEAQPEVRGTTKPSAPSKVEDKQPVKAEKAKAVATKPAAPASSSKKPETPEELCGITAKMSKDAVRERLALLYKRYNRATSSLDAEMRTEAEAMLDAIVVVRDKVFGPI